MMNLVPVGWFSSTRITPFCSVTIRLTMAKPRPVPRCLVEKKGRNSFSLSSGAMPGPLSATVISATSCSASSAVRTQISFWRACSRASAALSIRLATARFICPGSTWARGKSGDRSRWISIPPKRPSKIFKAFSTMSFSLEGIGLEAGKRAKAENSSTSDFRVATSRPTNEALSETTRRRLGGNVPARSMRRVIRSVES